MTLTLGIDLACRTAHVASLAGADGVLVWSGRTFFTRAQDLQRLWDDLGCDPGELTVVMEPTRNAWVPVAQWFKRAGVKVVLVPTTQSADLREYYSKHTKNDRPDSALLARLPLLHPEGLREHTGAGPAEPLRRAVKLRSSIMKRPRRSSPGSTRCSSCSGRAGTKSSAPTSATPACTCCPATPTRTTCCGWARHGCPGS